MRLHPACLKPHPTGGIIPAAPTSKNGTVTKLAQYRARKVEPAPMMRRARPQDFAVRPRRRFDWFPIIVLGLLAGGAAAWHFSGAQAGKKPPYDLVMKSSDKGVAQKGLVGWEIVDEGMTLPVGATIDTRKSARTVFSFGPGSSLRMAAHTVLSFHDSRRIERKAYAGLDLKHGRIWLVSGGDVNWQVQTPLCTVKQLGRCLEIRVGDDGSTRAVSWQGQAEMTPEGHVDRVVSIGDKHEASFDANRTLTNAHPTELTRDDPWLAWNLLETMQRAVKEKPVAQ